MSAPYCDGTEAMFEQCPKCGHQWEGEMPDNPAWIEWHCEHCGYCEGQYYDDAPCMLMEGDSEKQTTPLPPRKEQEP